MYSMGSLGLLSLFCAMSNTDQGVAQADQCSMESHANNTWFCFITLYNDI